MNLQLGKKKKLDCSARLCVYKQEVNTQYYELRGIVFFWKSIFWL